jgi:renalase
MKIAIIGTGVSASILAFLLSDKNHEIILFEKARGLGGRLSGKRTDFGKIEHGAQFFTVKTRGFSEFLLKNFTKDELISWHPKIAAYHNGLFNNLEVDYKILQPAMNQFSKNLLSGFKINLTTKIDRLELDSGKWHLYAGKEKFSSFDLVISTAPPLQSYDLLKNIADFAEQLKNYEMLPTHAFLGVLKDYPDFDYEAVKFLDHEIFSWFAVQNSKDHDRSNYRFILHTKHEWSLENLEITIAEFRRVFVTSFQEFINLKETDFKFSLLHLWRYASPLNYELKESDILFDWKNNLAVCGDYLTGGNIEAAFLSAKNLANKLRDFYG